MSCVFRNRRSDGLSSHKIASYDFTIIRIDQWPLLQRNKVEDSKIEEPVKKCAESSNAALKALAQKA